MVNQEMLSYITSGLQRGVDREKIEQALKTAKWSEQDITDTMQTAIRDTMPMPSSTPPPLTSMPGIGELLKTSWGICTKRFASFIPIIIIPQFAFFVIAIIAGIAAMAQAATPNVPLNPWLSIVLGVIGLLSVIFSILIQPVAQLGLIYAIREHERPVSLGEAYRLGWQKIGAFWVLSFLTGLIVMTGLLLLIIPGIIFSVWFAFAYFLLVDEDMRGMNALLKSKEYVRGLWWKIVIRSIAVGIIVIVIALVLSGISNAIFGKNEIANAILNFALQLFILPFTMTYSYQLYRSVKALKPNMVFTPNPSQRTLFIVLAAVGPICLLIIMGLAGFAMFNFFRQPLPAPQYQLPNTLQQYQNSAGPQLPVQ